MMPPRLTSPDSSVSLHDYEHTVTSMQPDGGTIVGFWTRVVGSPPSSSTALPVHFRVLTLSGLKKIGGALEALGVICI